MRIVIIGSGFGGIGLAIRLKRAGFEDFTILEKDQSLGGTWRDNTYPGAACDLMSFAYCFSFAQKTDLVAQNGRRSPRSSRISKPAPTSMRFDHTCNSDAR